MLSRGIISARFFVTAIIAAVAAFLWTITANPAEQTIVVVGDSLSSGYGLRIEQSWVAMLQDRLHAEDYGYEIINASVPGDTSSGGLARLPRLLEAHQPILVIIELGGNDGLRGQSIERLRENLRTMVELTQESGATPILTGIRIPPNYGSAYAEALAGTYPELSRQLGVPLVEFLMEGVALDENLMQPDGIHPNADGNTVMLENVWMVLAELL
jgi:acyl-CoA thioesterase-1